jgi:hypothetical protein
MSRAEARPRLPDGMSEAERTYSSGICVRKSGKGKRTLLEGRDLERTLICLRLVSKCL